MIGWLNLVSFVVPVSLNENKDVLLWRLEKKGRFSTNSLVTGKEVFWKAKISLKINFFSLIFKERGHTD